MSLTTESVQLPGVDPADPPSEILTGRLWQGGCPVDFDWVAATGITAVVDVADPDAHPPVDAIEALVYLKCPLVDGADLPDRALALGLARLVADLLRGGHRALVHCSFGRNRSGLLTTLVVREILGVSGPEALAHVRARRDRVVNNDAFETWLTSLPAPGPAAAR